MSAYKRPTTAAEFEANFKQKKPLMSATEAYYESSRCLFCYDAPCIKACPTHIDVPMFIKQIHTKNTKGAAKTIFKVNWLGNACGLVCPTEVLCEGACVYTHQDVAPIQIGRLQNYATQSTIAGGEAIVTPGAENGKKVAVIGAGPSGIACACELRILGYVVDIFEAKDKPSGLMIHGIAPYKITDEEVLQEILYLQQQLGFTITYGSPIQSEAQLQDLERCYDAIFLGVGLGKTAAVPIKGDDKEDVIGAVMFIETLRRQRHRLQVPDTVVIIGGGNTAMDMASESVRMGAQSVIIAYRRSRSEMGAYAFEYDFAIGDGVDSLFNVIPLEIMGDDKVEGVRFAKTTLENGMLHIVEGSEFTIACDLVIKATGQVRQEAFYTLIANLDIDAGMCIKIDENYQTSNSIYFAGGDAVNGGAEVVHAAYEGKMAARGIAKWLSSPVPR